jgi:hypothetical protein
MNNIKKWRVVMTTVQPGQEAKSIPIRGNLTEEKAKALRDSLSDKQKDYDPNNIVSYLVEPA